MSKNIGYSIPFFVMISFVLASCGGSGQKKAARHYTVEDTVRLQLGGKLYDLEITPDDSITVFHSRYYQPEQGELYREYGFIVHNRYTPSHRRHEPAEMDFLFESLGELDNYGLDSLVQTEYVDPAVDDFLGYWIQLAEHGGDYYFDDYMAPLNSLRLTDSIVTRYNMDGLEHHRIWRATVSPDGSLSIMFDEESEMKLEPADRKREIYRFKGFWGGYFIPARAIHNVELIQWANTTGDLIF